MKKVLTTVNITSSNEPTALHAKEELSAYLQKKGVSICEDGFPISILVDASLEQDSYKIEATLGENESMTVRGDNNGVLYGVYNFLEAYAGIRFFTPTLEICPPGDITIPHGLVLEQNPVTTFAFVCVPSAAALRIRWMMKIVPKIKNSATTLSAGVKSVIRFTFGTTPPTSTITFLPSPTSVFCTRI